MHPNERVPALLSDGLTVGGVLYLDGRRGIIASLHRTKGLYKEKFFSVRRSNRLVISYWLKNF